ncbi:Hypothetical protein CINCED_3A024433 [Cinara cedri]|uniref:Uncharacterized protein n=1 Tax=Cinara cedri TaxID=506608 RepID=A0A5E4MN69_9HEMI|nr:Hypothetical protein CINCED_3A024433 [Cinara cedri]
MSFCHGSSASPTGSMTSPSVSENTKINVPYRLHRIYRTQPIPLTRVEQKENVVHLEQFLRCSFQSSSDNGVKTDRDTEVESQLERALGFLSEEANSTQAIEKP